MRSNPRKEMTLPEMRRFDRLSIAEKGKESNTSYSYQNATDSNQFNGHT